MSNMRRYWQPAQLCFLTNVTFARQALLVEHVDLLWEAICTQQQKKHFDLMAWAILPDHMHLLLNPGENDTSNLMRRIKLAFSSRLRRRQWKRSARTWQYRFWDRIMRDNDDVNRHIDYIHYNPVKHGLVDDPFLWPHSSLAEFYERGLYQRDWGAVHPVEVDGEFGE